jgi:peptidoglycan/LPS O-acetylase OafA/YrhL
MTEDALQAPPAPDLARTTAEAFVAYQATLRFGCLDGLRFFCIMAVLWHHAPVHTALADPAPILGRGFLGVDFFFVLSGFLITTLLLREEARTGRFSLRGFYWRRFLRIVPVYFFVVTLVSAYYVLLKGETQYTGLVPFYYLFLSNFLITDIPLLAPTWSLAVEEQYYLLWPLLLLALPRRWILPVLGVLIAVNVAGILGVFAPLGIVPVETGVLRIALPNATYAPILMGSAVALVLHDRRSFAWVWPLLGGRLAPPLAFAVLLTLMALAPPDLRGWPNLAIHLAMSACLVTLVIRDRNVLTPLMSLRPIARVGEISYGLYLYHLIALAVVMKLLPGLPPLAVFLVYSALAMVIAELSFRTLERVFLRLR